MGTMWRFARRLMRLAAVVAASAFAAFVVGDAWLSRSLPDLERWHRVAPEGEVTGGNIHLKTNLSFDVKMRVGGLRLTRGP